MTRSTPVATTGHAENNSVNHPIHYNADPSGIEAIEIIRHRNFNVGSAMKYLWRAGLKVSGLLSDRQKEIEDIKKAIWYLNDEVKRLEAIKD